ncbi:Bacteriophage abortive infection AbiH [Pseudovibrio sp. Tun.PSC04-5.I4]|nr:Bacteriophage abortive infection AbiH [Pseudovibrio sp. Tun.PSC04-5.I4]
MGAYPDTSFSCFGSFLKENRTEIFDLLVQVFNFQVDPLASSEPGGISCWGEFESTLGNFEAEQVWESVRDYLDDSDPHRSGEASWEAERIIDVLTKDMRHAFKDFVNGGSEEGAIQYPNDIDGARLRIIGDASFLSFNYTDTLERYYGIHPSQICYIHGKAYAGEDLLLGHGVGSEDLGSAEEIESTEPPTGLTPEQQEMWYEEKSDQYSFSYELAEVAINSYWANSFKNAKQNISDNEQFFKSQKNVWHIIVLGHSLSEVDLDYFVTIAQHVVPNAIWYVSYYDEHVKHRFKTTLSNLGISADRLQLFKMEELRQANSVSI